MEEEEEVRKELERARGLVEQLEEKLGEVGGEKEERRW